MSSLRRIGRALLAFWLVIVAGTVGYVILGFGFVDAVYQTVTTVTTVGFREVHPLSTVGVFFTIVLILVGVGTALYTRPPLSLDVLGRSRAALTTTDEPTPEDPTTTPALTA